MASATYRGRMIVNDTDYTGSFVDPNPGGVATDSLTKLGIDGEIYEIQGGGGGGIGDVTNYYGVFIDTNNIIQPFTHVTDTVEHTYVATEDCAVTYYIPNDTNTDVYIKLDGVIVGGQYGQYINATSDIVYMKKGQIFSYQTTYTVSSGAGYTVYGLQSGDRIPALIQDAQIYSEDERVIGVWTDGKPLYQITVIGRFNGSVFDYDTGIRDMEAKHILYPLFSKTDAEFSEQLSSINDPDYFKYIAISKGVITISKPTTGAYGSNNEVRLTIQYTKTNDTAGSGGYQAYGMSPVIYSNKEREIGVWTDNKPLYAKTYNLNSSVRITNSGTNISQYIDNRNDIETLVRGESFCTVGTSSQSVQSTALWVGYTSKDNIMAYCAEGATSNCITLYYTKTTDSPKRTGYELLDIQENQIIVDATRYSTKEKIVGTWVDNKPLYQKTFLFNQQVISDNAWTSNILGTVGSGIEIVDFDGTFGLTGNPHFADFSYYRGSSEYFTAYTPNNNGHNDDINVRPNMNAGVSVTLDKVTIWYTKDSDAAGSGGYQAYGFSPIIYSTEEREVGVWKNNKPLYQKTCVFGSVSGQTANLSLGIANIEEAFLCADASYVNDGTCPLPYVTGTAYSNNIGGFFDIGVSDTSFAIRIGQSMAGSVNNVVLTVRYTKTTDVAGSGEYNTLGVPNVHCDNTEKVIGTWFGETLYERTLNVGSISSTDDGYVIGDKATLKIKDCVELYGKCTYELNGGDKQTIPLPNYNNSAYYIRIYYESDIGVALGIPNLNGKTGIWFEFSSEAFRYYNNDIYVTIRYTKSTT